MTDDKLHTRQRKTAWRRFPNKITQTRCKIMEKESQTKIILERLQDGDKVTALSAFKMCGSLRLSSIIFNLRERGYNIHTEMVTRNKKRIAEYSLIQK
nr:MAG TPA: helix-turn-helix domain protein [Caudoviricetes sp.]